MRQPDQEATRTVSTACANFCARPADYPARLWAPPTRRSDAPSSRNALVFPVWPGVLTLGWSLAAGAANWRGLGLTREVPDDHHHFICRAGPDRAGVLRSGTDGLSRAGTGPLSCGWGRSRDGPNPPASSAMAQRLPPFLRTHDHAAAGASRARGWACAGSRN